MFLQYKYGEECWRTPEQFLRQRLNGVLTNARNRAEEKGVPFDIDVEYLLSIFPSDNKCPVFGIELVWGGDTKNSPSLDRIHPALGYVKGNLIWVSDYANKLKSFNSLDTLRTLLAFYENLERRNE